MRLTLENVIDVVDACEADCRCGNVRTAEVATRLRAAFDDGEDPLVVSLRRALVDSGHSRFCGLIIGDEHLCTACRQARRDG